ncbi:hypothetical protein KKA14_11535, partial [bacterium]|nr:hypothetical protein [bacterium]
MEDNREKQNVKIKVHNRKIWEHHYQMLYHLFLKDSAYHPAPVAQLIYDLDSHSQEPIRFH